MIIGNAEKRKANRNIIEPTKGYDSIECDTVREKGNFVIKFPNRVYPEYILSFKWFVFSFV